MKKATSRKRIVLFAALSLLAAMLLSAACLVTYAYFSTLPRVYTDDNTSQIARIGMRINLLFERLRTGESTNFSGTITYPDGKEVTFDSEASWGSPENPYIISMSRHMINLYALQQSGYFYDRYVVNNYDSNGDYIDNSSSKPYFLVCDPETGKPVFVDGTKGNENIEIRPIGNDQYPFIGCVGGAPSEGVCTTPGGKTSISSVIANFTVNVNDDMPDVGLFGKIGYLGDETDTTNVGGVESFNGSISGVNDLLLYDIQIVSKPASLAERIADHLWADEISENVRYEEDHHIGILAGHVEYASIYNISVYYSNSETTAIDVSNAGGNYQTDSGIIGLVYNLNPSIEGNTIGASSGSTIAGRVEGAGQEWGASIDMKTLFTRLRATNAQYSSTAQRYVSAETITVNEATGEITSDDSSKQYTNYSTVTDNSGQNGSTVTRYIFYYYDADHPENGSFVFGDYDANDNGKEKYAMFHGKSLTYFPKTLTTYTKKDEFLDAWYIHEGSNYLSVSGTALSNASSENAAHKWLMDENGRLYTNVDTSTAIVKYYLNRNGTTGVTLSQTSNNTVWNFTEGTGEEYTSLLYTTVNGNNYYLDYENGWTLTSYDRYYLISDSDGHYLTGGTSAVSSTTVASDASEWILSSETGNTTLSLVSGGATYYLSGASGELLMSGTSFTWNRDENGNVLYTTIQGLRYDLAYDGGWKLLPVSGKKITDGNGHYLAVSLSGASDAALSGATVWQFSSETGDTQIYTVLNGAKQYLTVTNGVPSLTTTATTWHRSNSGDSLYLTSGNTDYYLEYDNGWKAVPLVYFVIHDNAGNYLVVNGANSFGNAAESDATHFYFSNPNGASSSGTVYCEVNGEKLYLRNNNGTLQTSAQNNATTWTNNGTGSLTANGTTYRLGYNNGWKMINTAQYYLISDGSGHYLSANAAFNGLEPTDEANATHWTYSNNRISVMNNGTTYYLRVNEEGGGCGGTATYTLQLSTTNSNNTWNVTGNRYYVTIGTGNNRTYHYLQYNNGGWTTTTTQNQGTVMTFSQRQDNPQAFVVQKADAAPEVSSVDHTSSGTALTFSGPMENVVSFKETTEQTTVKTVQTVAGGNDTYIPLTADSTSPFTVNPKNTGYIVGGSHASYQQASGDVRFSSYYTFNGSLTTGNYFLGSSLGQGYRNGNQTISGNTYYSNRLEVLTRSYLTNGFVRVSDAKNASNNIVSTAVSSYTKLSTTAIGLKKYDAARTQLDEMFLGNPEGTGSTTGSIYGVHFMDSVISMQNLVTAPKVMINEKTYENYEMPEDCIDFRLRTKGYINFFAGTYYVNSGKENNCFFSLSQISRDSNNKITAIKRIEKIYGDPTSEKKSYIYKFEGESAPTLPTGYVEMFDTDWIERPSQFVERAMYYFEIPVNGGEYALGSVAAKSGESARYGAYLCYLDIGTSAADHTSVLGTIDFVYDNLSNKIVVVPDTSETDPSLNYYVPSLAIMYSKNTDESNSVEIDSFTVNVRRTITSTSDANATLTTTFGGDDSGHLDVINQYANRGDTLVTTN